MKKIINILIPHRNGLENKWWHRLFTVILFGSGITIFILSVFLIANTYSNNWVTYSCPTSGSEGLDCIFKAKAQTDPQYQESLKNLSTQIKIVKIINFPIIITDILISLIISILVSILWTIFWSLGVYKAFLYVLYGKS